MLKIAQLLSKYQSVILVILLAPLLGLFFEFHLEMVPENPHLTYKVSFEVPARATKEILEKVTRPIEKIFNGLPYLVGIQSKTENERAWLQLKFKEKAKESSTYLNIQEKLDRVRLILPRDVKSYSVELMKQYRPADLKLKFDTPYSVSQISKVLNSKKSAIVKSDPALESGTEILIYPFPQKLYKNKLSLSDLVNALKSLGISTTLGRKNGILIETGLNFQNIDELKASLIGARGGRPIRLSDVAELKVSVKDQVGEFNIWLDQSRASISDIEALVKGEFDNVEFSYPRLSAILEQSLQPILFIFLIIALQFLTLYYLKIPFKTFIFFGFFDATVIIHFLFWKELIHPPFTVLDLHSLVLTLLIGTVFLAVLTMRIRSYFIDFPKLKKVPKTIYQAKLFSLAELMPTMLTVSVALWIVSLPLLSSALNLPSRAILESFFYFGMPALFFMLLVLPLSIKGDFFNKKISVPKKTINWHLNPKQANLAMWGILVLSALSISLFQKFNVSIKEHGDNSSQKMVHQFRGYNNELVFKTNLQDINKAKKLNLAFLEKNEVGISYFFDFSNSGKRFLSDLNITGLANALTEMRNSEAFGFLDLNFNNKNKIPLFFKDNKIKSEDVSQLLFSNSKVKESPISLHTVTESYTQLMPIKVLRDNMSQANFVSFLDSNKGTFKKSWSKEVTPTAWTSYLLEQFDKFQSYHFISFVFLFFLFAIYLNSFVRSILVLFFCLSIASLLYIANLVFPVAYHADSLWLLYVGVFIAIFQILIYTRVIDIERTRGYERDLSIEEIKTTFAPGVYICSWIFVLALLVAGLTEQVSFLPTLGFWIEATYVSIFTAVFLPLSTHYLFPLFYLTSEETVNRLAFRIYRLLLVWRK